jgi:hypothetical protein
MAYFPCPYLGGSVELTPEREAHIAERHPDLLPDYRDKISLTLAAPDEVRRSDRSGVTRTFARWFDDVRGGKHIVIAVVSELEPERHWIITAYIARRLSGGTTEWKRS